MQVLDWRLVKHIQAMSDFLIQQCLNIHTEKAVHPQVFNPQQPLHLQETPNIRSSMLSLYSDYSIPERLRRNPLKVCTTLSIAYFASFTFPLEVYSSSYFLVESLCRGRPVHLEAYGITFARRR